MAGVHRIQRVPGNEKNGRRHSSTVTVAVASDQPVATSNVRAEDVTVTTFRAPGAGGQHRNKTDSGVRLAHRPSGITVTATESRSQQENRAVAWQRLRDAMQAAEIGAAREVRAATKARQFGGQRDWTWCSWRDELVTPDGRRMSMKRALRGGLDRLAAQ